MLLAFALAVAAGFAGALLGLGGGIIIVPGLTLLLGVDIRFAIGASIVSVIATSSGASAAYVKERLANVRVGMFLEVATTLGAITGAFLAGMISGRWLYLMFALLLAFTAVAMWRRPGRGRSQEKPDRLADRLELHAEGVAEPGGAVGSYRVSRSRLGLALSYVAGVVSALLGVGGGVMKVPTMTLGMGIPLKAASATSNFMIGVTAAASAGVYFTRGDINPFIAGPVAIGVLVGAIAGARVIRHVHTRLLRIAFTIVLVFISVEMFRKGVA